MSPKTAAVLTSTDIKRYRESLKRRQNLLSEQNRLDWEKAQVSAGRAAALLKTRFNARRVVLFGSAVHPDLFHQHSDIDLAAWGIDDRDYYRAVGVLQTVDPQFAIDLILFEDAPGSLQETILREGIDL